MPREGEGTVRMLDDRLRNIVPGPFDEGLLQALEAFATDGVDREWGWYTDHVPALVAEIRRLRDYIDRQPHIWPAGHPERTAEAPTRPPDARCDTQGRTIA